MRRDLDSAIQKEGGRFRKGTMATVLTGAVTAAASDAGAGIIYTELVNASPEQTLTFDGSSESSFDLVSDAGMMSDLDLGLEATDFGMMSLSSVEFSILSVGMSEYLGRLDAGDTVDGSLDWDSEGWLRDGDTDDLSPEWSLGQTGYAGFRFDLSGLDVYGWMEVEFASSGEDFTVRSWAYEEDGSGLPAGVVPEPSSVLLVALGLAGFAGLRKRVFHRAAE
ncbi:MAG: hypothetical protein CMN75_01630 [Spirochaeta sp.]|nr:hypothetical protein [Spirochaeta sp.]